MTKTTALTILSLLFINFSYGQNREKYAEQISEAMKLYDTKDYKQSGEKYSEAFADAGDRGAVRDRYNAACSWSLAGQVDSAFVQLYRISEKGNFTNYTLITTDTDLDNLHADQRWNSVLDLVKANKDKAEANLDKRLTAALDSIYETDQGLRRQIGDVEKEYGRDSPEMKALWKEIAETDSLNLIKIEKILDERGWLGSDVIGRRGNATLFLVIQHSNLSVQEKYLPMMREAVAKGNAQPQSLALLEDRVALGQGKEQIYGSQIGRDPQTGVYFVSPLRDPDHVDERRTEVGLGPLADYVARWNIVWNPEEYKKELPTPQR